MYIMSHVTQMWCADSELRSLPSSELAGLIQVYFYACLRERGRENTKVRGTEKREIRVYMS